MFIYDIELTSTNAWLCDLEFYPFFTSERNQFSRACISGRMKYTGGLYLPFSFNCDFCCLNVNRGAGVATLQIGMSKETASQYNSLWSHPPNTMYKVEEVKNEIIVYGFSR